MPNVPGKRHAASLLIALVVGTYAPPAAGGDTGEGFVSLLGGRDLAGWKTTGNWVVEEDGVLAIRPRPGEKGWTRYDAYLWTERQYGDFVLDIEYKHGKGGNSGVFVRVKDPKNPVNTGIEVQILDSHGKRGKLGHHDCGGVIRTVGPSKNMARPAGQWNRMIVTCRKSRMTVELNGEQIIDVKLDESPMKDRPVVGHIGLQDHGQPLWFRNIRIKELAGASLGPAGYVRVWSDEFDGQALDMKKWGYRSLGRRRDAYNVKDTVTLDGRGHLVLTTKRVGDRYHTAMIGTQGKYETAFGHFECRAKLQTQLGHWSAFWLQSPTMGKPVGEAKVAGTEIDIFEYLRKRADRVHHTLHWDGYKKDHKSAGHVAHHPGLGTGWHGFGLLWTRDEYVFYVDGKESWRTKKAVSHRPEYIILSLEVGGWAGSIAEAKLPDHLLVDYVRVYKRKESAGGASAQGR